MNLTRRALMGIAAALVTFTGLVGCTSAPASGDNGRLILIGGGLEGTNEPVFKRMLELARGEDGVARIVIATAASLNEGPAFESISDRLRKYDPKAELATISRDTAAADAIARIDAAKLAFFTGGDQKRIVDKYRRGGRDGPEATALRRLLARGGTIAGTSAGDAMMTDPMFLSGGSDEALGLREGKGVQIGRGMGFLPGMISDSHFFERDRLGRLVAALEKSGVRWGIGVGEDAAVEVELETMALTRLSDRGVLLVDGQDLAIDGTLRKGIRALPLPKGERFTLESLRKGSSAAVILPPPTGLISVERPARGADQPPASWMLFASESKMPRELICGRHIVRATPLSVFFGTTGTWFDVEISPAPKPEAEVPQGD